MTCKLTGLAGCACLLALASPDSALAQREGTFAAGGSVALVTAPDADVRGRPRVGPLIRYGESRNGWGVRIGFNWYGADVDEAVNGATERAGRLRVRPIMGGYGYMHVFGPFAVSANVLGGYAFNAFSTEPSFRDAYLEARGADALRVRVSNEFVLKPEISTWIDLSDTLAVNVSLGYMVVRPALTLASAFGSDRRAINADVVMLKIGLVHSVF